MQLRDYQSEAILSTRNAILDGVKKPLIVAPTASGKSIIIAGMVQSALTVKPGNRVLVLCFQGEILSQNEKALLSVMPNADTGIYCASLGRKETENAVIFASRDSLGRNPMNCGAFDIVIVDEAHLVSTNENTHYGKIFAALQPRWIIGFTGTPWRLDNGKIWGKKGFFEKVSYNIALDLLIERDFLSDYIFPEQRETVIEAEGVKRGSSGDYNLKELTTISSTEEIVDTCLDKWEELAEGRRCTIFFCCSIVHANLVASKLVERNVHTAYLDGKTIRSQRAEILEECKKGRFRAIVNVGVLTTGVDIPIIDCVVNLRATQSASLFVQMCGRGLRKYPNKPNCLMIDLTDNFKRFGSLSSPIAPPGSAKEPPKCPNCDKLRVPKLGHCPHCKHVFVKGSAWPKECPTCLTCVAAASAKCPYCDHIFISHDVDYVVDARQTSGWFIVKSYSWEYAKTSKGDLCVIVNYDLENVSRPIRQWIMYALDWNKQGRKQIENMRKKVIELVKVDNTKATFPKIKGVLYQNGEPIQPFREENQCQTKSPFFLS